MNAPLDLDQLQTFIAIADSGSFTRAAGEVHRTQSAVSMQMRRLEERIGKALFEKDGRLNRLTEDGEKLLAYARRMIRLNRETIAAFAEDSLEGRVRIGTPDDYAERFLPEIMARFSRSNPLVEISVICEPTVNLLAMMKSGALDIAITTFSPDQGKAEILRREPLLWVTSASHSVHEEKLLPLAVGRPSCIWRQLACDLLAQSGQDYRIIFTSWSATAIIAAVLSGAAISVLPECALRPGMRVLGEADGFPPLPHSNIALLRGTKGQTKIMDALARHIAESLDNISFPALEENSVDAAAASFNMQRRRSGKFMQSW